MTIILSTHTQGGWASKGLVDGKVELEHLREYYVDQHKLTFPVAIFEGKKRPTEDGGSLPERDPNFENFSVHAFPQVVVVDTKGIIRQILPTFTRDDEERITTLLKKLLAETGGAKSSSAP